MRQGQCVYLPYVPLIPARLGNARQGRGRICLPVSEKLIHERQIKPAPDKYWKISFIYTTKELYTYRHRAGRGSRTVVHSSAQESFGPISHLEHRRLIRQREVDLGAYNKVSHQ